MILKIITILLPWRLKRIFLNKWYGFEIHKDAYIGFAWMFPKKLIMDANSKIDHFTVAINLDKIEIGKNALIGRGNWITGFPTKTNSPHFNHQSLRRAELKIGNSAAITKNHHFDCTNIIEIGAFSTIAGYSSQFLTHSIDLVQNIQDSNPIYIGEYSFIGTNVVVLGGSKLPARSVLGAKSLLNKKYTEEWTIYGGIPSKEIAKIPSYAKYFSRENAVVH